MADTKESTASLLKAIIEQGAKAMNASYIVFFPGVNQDTMEFGNAICGGREEMLDGFKAATQWVLTRAQTLVLETEANAKEILGYPLERNILPLIGIPVMNEITCCGALLVSFPDRSAQGLLSCLPASECLAKLIAVALENDTLREELHRKEEQVRDLIRDTLDAQEAERERICLEVHDGVTQTLASAFQYLQTLETSSPDGTPSRQLLIRASALVRQAIQESREVINSLQPATLRDLGLVATLRQEMRQLEEETRWQVEFKADNVRLPRDVETGLYRIIREAIANVRKHANSQRISVSLTSNIDWLKVEVKDWGIGFNPSISGLWGRKGTGLLSMRKRAELLKGKCIIESSPGRGTIVRVEIPSGEWKRK